MTRFSHIQNIYFIGIGGIGMSALARYFHTMGKNVAGYDKTVSTLTRTLEKEGIQVLYSDYSVVLPEPFKKDKNALIVYTPAIPQGHRQYDYFVSEGVTVAKRATVLGWITENCYTMAVAGTHGKTTTTAILAHLLKESGIKLTAFIGGITENYQNNIILTGNEVMVVEADEYDRSFLKLAPNMAAITSMDADHLDIYGGREQLLDSFRAFAGLLPEDGKLFHKNGLPLKGISVGIEDNAKITAEDIEIANGNYFFNLKWKGKIIEGFSFQLPGRHNLLNAVTALAMALEYGCPAEKLIPALRGFKGVHRRFTYKIKTENKVLIDDYAHHPEEIKAAHQAVREMHPGKEVLAVFQPHLFSRTQDFADEFASALALFDRVMLLDIYPAREKPIRGITSAWLLEKIENPNKALVSKEALSEEIKKAGEPVIILLGAGDIGEEVETVKKALLDEA